jgi:hypothetical protein
MINRNREAFDAISNCEAAVDRVIRNVTTREVLRQVNEELDVPRFGAIPVAVAPVRDAIRADVETTSDGESADPA